MKSWLFRGVALAALGFSTAAVAQSTHTLAEDAAAFGAREAVQHPDLSADGSTVVYVTPGPGRKSIAVAGNLDTGKFSQVAASSGDPEVLRWCNFVSATRVICNVSGNISSNLFKVLGFSRLLSMNTDGTDAKLLGQPSSSYDAWIRQVDAEVVDWLDGTDNKVMLERAYVPEEGKIGTHFVRDKSGLGVDRVDAKTLVSDMVEPPRDGAGNYLSDGQGHVRLMDMPDTTVPSSGYLSGRIKYLYRSVQARDWRPLGNYDREDFEPLAVDAETNRLYALKKKSGRMALYAIKLDGDLAETEIADNPRVDIDGVVRFGDGQRVIGYTYAEAKRTTVYFDPEFKALAESLSRVLPQLPLVRFVDSSHDGRKLLIHAGSDNDAGRYYLFDRDHKTLTPAMVDRPDLEGRTLAKVTSVSITAPDGASIPAYLTLPPGKPAKGLPAVILPHGGPSSRDYWGWNPSSFITQFLAARGYVVLQPEYRGSAGYGDAWLNENGFKNWRTSIGDITASARWLAAQGIADPNRLAIAGWSYGGYAALQSAVTEPGLYKAVVAVAPVTDLQIMKDELRDFTIYELAEKEIGTGPHVIEGSPLRHAGAIQAPVLLAHGTLDSNVAIEQSEKMDAALKSAGKQSELLTFKGLDHQLDDSDARTELLTKMGELLDRTIGH